MCLIISDAQSYLNVVVHRDINKAIVEQFLANYSKYERFKNYSFIFTSNKFLGPAVLDMGYFTVNTADRDLTIKEWIIEGGFSADEPEAPAALRHFYDPIGINQGKLYLTDLKVGAANPEIDAIHWHFDGYDPKSISNEWSWDSGKEYMRKAIEASTESVKEGYIAKAFRSLGEVLHNTADMGCPPHVRNDAHGGWPGVGGSDPYESAFDPNWIPKYSGNSQDPSLSPFFNEEKKAININKKLAEFTNKYFFTTETIFGKGVANYKSTNKMPDYPAPVLDKLEYEDDSFNYYYTFPSGRKIEMCNDRSLFLGYISQNFRSYPRVTVKNVESQAQELLPNIMAAGMNVIRNFIPQFEFAITANINDKKIKGDIYTVQNEEYPIKRNYSGLVKFMLNGKTINSEAQATNGKFEVVISDLKAGDKVRAFIVFADMMIKSNEVLVDNEKEYTALNVKLSGYTKRIKYDANGEGNHLNDTVTYGISLPFTIKSFQKTANTYKINWDNTNNFGIREIGEVTVTLNSNNTASVKYSSESSSSFYYANTTYESGEIPFSEITASGTKVYLTQEVRLKSFYAITRNGKDGKIYEEWLSFIKDSKHPFSLTIELYP